MTNDLVKLVSEDITVTLGELDTEVTLPSKDRLRLVYNNSSYAVNEMIIAAANNNLTFEVIESYSEARQDGLGIEDAVNYARRAWDI